VYIYPIFIKVSMSGNGKGPTMLSLCDIHLNAHEYTGLALIMPEGTKNKIYDKVPVVDNPQGLPTIPEEFQGQAAPSEKIRFCLLLQTSLNGATSRVLPRCRACIQECGSELVTINNGRDKMVGIAINRTDL
jgi:hypothetical protein